MPVRELGTEASDESAGAARSSGGAALMLGRSGEAKGVSGCRCMTMGIGAMGVAPLCCCDGTAGLGKFNTIVLFQTTLLFFDGGISADAEIEERRKRTFLTWSARTAGTGTVLMAIDTARFRQRHPAQVALPSRSSRLNASRSLWPSHLQRALPLSVSQPFSLPGAVASWSQCARPDLDKEDLSSSRCS